MSARKSEIIEEITFNSDLLEVVKKLEKLKETEASNIPKKLKMDISKLIKQLDQITNK